MLLGLQLVFFNTYKHCANAVPASRLDLGRASNASHAGGNARHCSSAFHKCTEHACTCAQNSEKKVTHSHDDRACYSCEPTHEEIAKHVKAFLPARGALADTVALNKFDRVAPRRGVVVEDVNPLSMQLGKHMDEAAHVKKGVSRWETVQMNPLDLDIKNRFDIVVKTVYAIFLRRGNVPVFVTDMYNRHLEVWNNFKEPCTFAGEKDWFDTTKPCVNKSSAAEFQRSFAQTLDSIANDGFDTTQSLVPVTRMWFPLNGAHRIAAAIALGLPTMPVQRVASKAVYTWDRTFFTGMGFETKYADFAVLQWTLHVDNSSAVDSKWLSYIRNGTTHDANVHAVVVFPSTKARYKQHIVNLLNRNGAILSQRHIVFKTFDAADMFVQHLYPQEKWVDDGGSRGKTTPCYPTAWPSMTWILFWETSLHLSDVVVMKKQIRDLYHLGKHSIHISDTNVQALEIARMVFNRNSIVMLHRMVWSTPSQRKKSTCRIPKNINEQDRYYLDGRACAMVEQPGEDREPDNDMSTCGVPRLFSIEKKHWKNIDEMFDALNAANVSYALLRNFEEGVIHPNDAHPDIDMVLESLEPACCVMAVYGGHESNCVKNVQNQGQHVTVGGVRVKLDIRVLGDLYYGDAWVRGMLSRRVQGRVPNSNAWSVSDRDLLFSMIYHVLVHKKHIAKDYPDRIYVKAKALGYDLRREQCHKRDELEQFLKTHWMQPRTYAFVRPLDRNVPYNVPSEPVIRIGARDVDRNSLRS